MKPILEEFRELVGIDCASGKERMLADVLKRKLEALGFTVREDEAGRTFGGDTGNLIAILPGTRKGSVLFCSHMDRVKNGHGIKVREKDGVLYSGGDTILAADDVSGICAILDGVRRTLSSGNPHPRIEIGLLGRLVNGAPGHVRFAIHVKGKPAHAGNEPENGINAAHILCHILDTLPDGRVNEELVANFPILGTGNESTNVVCADAWAKGEARSRNLEELSRYAEFVKTHAEDCAKKTGALVSVEKELLYEPFLIEETAPILQKAKKALRRLGLTARVEAGGGGMDANIFNAKGLTSLGIATGYSKNHTLEENRFFNCLQGLFLGLQYREQCLLWQFLQKIGEIPVFCCLWKM